MKNEQSIINYYIILKIESQLHIELKLLRNEYNSAENAETIKSR